MCTIIKKMIDRIDFNDKINIIY